MAVHTAPERLANAMIKHTGSLAESPDFAAAVRPFTEPISIPPREKARFIEWLKTPADAERAVRLASGSKGDRDVARRLLERIAEDAPLLRDALGAWGGASVREMPTGERQSWIDLVRVYEAARQARRQQVVELIFRHGLTPDPGYVSAELLEAPEIVASAIDHLARGRVLPHWLTLVEGLCIRFDEVDNADDVYLDSLSETERFFGPVAGVETTTRTLYPHSRPRRVRPGSPTARARRKKLEDERGRLGAWVLVNEGRWRPFAVLTSELLDTALRVPSTLGSWHVYEIKRRRPTSRLSPTAAKATPSPSGVLRVIGFETKGANRANALTDDFAKQHATTLAREWDRWVWALPREVPKSK